MTEAARTDITHLLVGADRSPKQFEPNEAGWVPDGPCVVYRPGGAVLMEITYQRGIAHGPYRDFWTDGRLAAEGQYASGLQDGEWRFYNPDGSMREVIQFEAGREVVDWDAYFGRSRPTG